MKIPDRRGEKPSAYAGEGGIADVTVDDAVSFCGKAAGFKGIDNKTIQQFGVIRRIKRLLHRTNFKTFIRP